VPLYFAALAFGPPPITRRRTLLFLINTHVFLFFNKCLFSPGRNKIDQHAQVHGVMRLDFASIFRGPPPPPGWVGDGHLPTEMRTLSILNRGPVYPWPSPVDCPILRRVSLQGPHNAETLPSFFNKNSHVFLFLINPHCTQSQ
jgi:hypothetical protein